MSTRSQRIRRRSRQARVGASALLAACLAPPFAAQPATVADRVFDELQAARRAAGLPEFERLVDLERVALDRAQILAAMPHERRLATPVEGNLGESGIRRFRRASVHVDLNRGYTDPGLAFVSGWRRYRPGWNKVVDPGYDAIGIATEKGADGFVVLVAIMIEKDPAPVPDEIDLRDLERATLKEVDRARRENGLQPLTVKTDLTEIARARSEHMARHGYFDHLTPAGTNFGEGLANAGVTFASSAENLHRSKNVPEPARTAVDSWLASSGHREHLLSAEFTETGLGIALDREGQLFFTQIFIAP